MPEEKQNPMGLSDEDLENFIQGFVILREIALWHDQQKMKEGLQGEPEAIPDPSPSQTDP